MGKHCPLGTDRGILAGMKLHNYFRSSASFRVRIALNLKGLPFDYVPVHIARGDHKLPAYAGIAADQLVPALETDGHVLSQSMAIIEYLDETHPEPPLLPRDAVGRAQVRALRQGPPAFEPPGRGRFDVGATTMPRQLQIIERQIADAVLEAEVGRGAIRERDRVEIDERVAGWQGRRVRQERLRKRYLIAWKCHVWFGTPRPCAA